MKAQGWLSRAGMWAGMVLVPLVLALVVRADLAVSDSLKLTPSIVSLTSADNLPVEVKAQEAQTVRLLFDRDTATEFTAYGESHLVLSLDALSKVRAVKIYGAAPYVLSVSARQEPEGDFTPIEGLGERDLSALAEGWHVLEARTAVLATALELRLRPLDGAGGSGLKELEIWGVGERAVVTGGAALLEAAQGEIPPMQSRLYGSADSRGVVGPLNGPDIVPDDPADNAFAIAIDRDPSDFKRLYLTYELFGLSHWSSVVRSINGNAAQGGWTPIEAGVWSKQVERIDPSWLIEGDNLIVFSVPDGYTRTFTVKNVRILGELEDGSNFIERIESNVGGEPSALAAVYDGDEQSGWTPYPSAAAQRVEEPYLSVLFDKPTELDAVGLELVNRLKGDIHVSLYRQGQWVESAAAPVDGRRLSAGWNSLPIAATETAEGLRLIFRNGRGSTADINEIVTLGSGVGPARRPALRITYPSEGEFRERSAYIRGFIEPLDNGSGAATLYVAGKKIISKDGAFGAIVSKEEAGYGTQSDREAWQVEVKAVYPDKSEQAVTVVLDNYQSEGDFTQGELPPMYSEPVAPGQAKKITYDEAQLDVGLGAAPNDLTVQITPLREEDLPRLDQGMTNVTRGPRRGYRFTPHGTKFKKNVKLTVPYNKSLIPPGHTEEDIYTFYFDEDAGFWRPLERVEVDKASGNVVSYTDHFTDMINATITVPDHPNPTSFNPNQLKDIKAADPGAEITLIEPPQPNNMGDARLSYPIKVPPGRAGLQPQLAVSYSSGGSNGWLGLGWDVSVPAISVDTRWGVPRYDHAKESETYLLEGQQLTPVAHRSEPLPRSTGDKTFRTRVESGAFHKIIRHGTAPNNYWWEVYDKSGRRSTYGAPVISGNVGKSMLTDPADGDISKWALRKVEDTNGNVMTYSYEEELDSGTGNGTGAVKGKQIYLSEIKYSQIGNSGGYTVKFLREGSRRADVIIDARAGFKVVTAKRLRRIEVHYGGALVRAYDFAYAEGAFGKSVLASVTERGSDDNVFQTHRFGYFNEISPNNGFAAAADWQTGDDGIEIDFYGGEGRASILGGSKGKTGGGHLYVGFNPSSPSKQGSFGKKFGYSESSTEGYISLLDINGDGLPDKVFKSGSAVYYRAHRRNAQGVSTFDAPVRIDGLHAISREESETETDGTELYYGGNLMYNTSDTETSSSTYFSDVNGDGLVDLVQDGSVYFNYIGADNHPKFVEGDTSSTPVPLLELGSVDTNNLIDVEYYEQQYQERIDAYPLMDTVRRWVAPYAGRIRISGSVRLVEAPAATTYATDDGVRVAIQKNGGTGSELWSATLTDEAVHTPMDVDGITVARGDRIYFRLQSLFDGAHDAVNWAPVIEYLDVPGDARDVNTLNPYRYSAEEDFVFAGRENVTVAPVEGQAVITGALRKLGTTTDDVTVVVYKNGTELLSRTLAADQSGSIDLSDVSIAVRGAAGGGEPDALRLHLRVDSPIDLTQLQWSPILTYTSLASGEDASLVRVEMGYDADIYPANGLIAPQSAWTVSKTGSLTVLPRIELPPESTASGRVVVTVKKQGELLAKHYLDVVNGVPPQGASFGVSVTQGDQLYFDLSVANAAFAAALSGHAVEAVYGDPQVLAPFTVPHALHAATKPDGFPEAYRGWGTAGYNGNRGRATVPIVEADLILPPVPEGFEGSASQPLPPGYDPQDRKVYLLSGFPTGNRWISEDENCWVRPNQMSSSRLGRDYFAPFDINRYANVRAVDRRSKAEQQTLGGGFGPFSGGYAEGESWGELDFLDMNGDRFPDIVRGGAVQYTSAGGALTESISNGLGNIRKNSNTSGNFGIGGSPSLSKPNAKGDVAPKGTSSNSTGEVGSQMSPLGFSGSLGGGTSDTDYDLMDINGDGLPDRVKKDGGIKVQLNLGYSFTGQYESWGGSHLNEGKSSSQSIGPTLGFNSGEYAYGGGASLSSNDGYTDETLSDVNGDGLLDVVSYSGGAVKVKINLGGGFAAAYDWSANVGEGIGRSATVSLGGGGYFTYGIGPICLVGCYIIINPGGDTSESMSRPEVAIRDVDGDGFADHIRSTADSSMTVRLSRVGKSNLLQTVERPLGARITLDYERDGNTYQNPHSRWNLSKVETFDGVPGDGVDTQVTRIAYEGGYYDRLERDFYGYSRVVEQQQDGQGGVYRRMVREYQNSTYYNKGLMLSERTEDRAQQPYLETSNTYTLIDLDTGSALATPDSTVATVWQRLDRTDRAFFEGQPAPGKTTYSLFEYDSYGNVTGLFEARDLQSGAADDVTAQITYSYEDDSDTYIVDRATSIVVKNGNSEWRRREADIEPGTGNLTQVREFLSNNAIAVTDLTYDVYGNIKSVEGPANYRNQRYTVEFEYDDAVETHITRIDDSFGYTSYATYDLRFGKPQITTDINRNKIQYIYDEHGRPEEIYGPEEFGTDHPTLRFEYYPGAPEPYALTQHLDKYRDPGDPIETVLFTDGLKRVLQTKKDAELFSGENNPTQVGMTVSGRVKFDHVGRTVEQYYPSWERAGRKSRFNPAYNTTADPTVTVYDVLDRTEKIILPDGASTGMTYGFGDDRDGLRRFETVVTDAEGNQKVTYKDMRELITAVREHDGAQWLWTSYRYDPMKQIIEVRDALEHTTLIDYDKLGRRLSIDNPDTGKVSMTYDLAGNQLTKTTPKLRNANRAIRYEYDYTRRTAVRYPEYPENDVLYTYGASGAAHNRAGRLVKVTDGSGDKELFYGLLGEVVKEIRLVLPPPRGNSTPKADRYVTQFTYDTFGRLQQLVYPDGEHLTYRYDAGGELAGAHSERRGESYTYLNRLEYDEFGQRVFVEAGNAVRSRYTYRRDNRRLWHLRAQRVGDEYPIQNLTYDYDKVGNVLGVSNTGPVQEWAHFGGPGEQHYRYDTLYRLIHADGTYHPKESKTDRYTLDLSYSPIHNILYKAQAHEVVQPSGTAIGQKRTSYSWVYTYGGTQPHAPTAIGDRDFSYDENGNLTGWTNPKNANYRAIRWDEENRIREIQDNGHVKRYVYDGDGQRVFKVGPQGETAYINRYYTVRNGSVATKHIYTGEVRLASKLVGGQVTSEVEEAVVSWHPGRGVENRSARANEVAMNTVKNPHYGTEAARTGDKWSKFRSDYSDSRALSGTSSRSRTEGSGLPMDQFVYYYHPDHLGSSSYVTDRRGKVYEHLEYFPFGETWVEESGNTQRTPYLFTAKELDEETGYYYFGARYFDPRTSVWVSTDPILGKYLPSTPNERLSGKGGVYTSFNLNGYGYSFQNPVNYSDPDGNIVETAWDVANIVMGIASFADNVSEGNYGAAALDAIGVVADTVATAIPVVPGGAGTAIRTARMADKGIDALKGAKTAENLADAGSAGKKFVSTCSFAPDTLVMTKEGLKPIEAIKAGDEVLARDDRTGEQSLKRVLTSYNSLHHDALELRLIDPRTGDEEKLVTTSEHPFYVEGLGWLRADALKEGDYVLTAAGGWVQVGGATWLQSEQLAHNMEVAEFHTYFVGTSGAWVHNNCNLPRNADGTFASRAGGESGTAQRGRESHENYKTALGDEYDYNVTLPSGKKPDAVNWEKREVRELKSDRPKAQARGKRQVEGYRQELEEMTGDKWTAEVDSYKSE